MPPLVLKLLKSYNLVLLDILLHLLHQHKDSENGAYERLMHAKKNKSRHSRLLLLLVGAVVGVGVVVGAGVGSPAADG